MGIIGNAAIMTALVILILYFTGSFHVIDYGYIGVYKRGGALLNSWTEPGLHFLVPFITTYAAVQVTLQTDKVTNIPVSPSSPSAAPAAE
jgi:regulator of protease activity HflC (stomatin/prohibitin superfamily)